MNEAIDAKLFDFPAGAKPTFDQTAADRGDANHQFHQSFASFGIPLDGEQTFVQESLLAPNVHYLLGGSHNSILVEQAAGLVLLEAPLYEARSKSPKAAVLITVPAGGSYTIADATAPVAAYDVQNPHADGMLLGYLPTSHIAFNSDLFVPGTPAFVAPPFLDGGKALYQSITVTDQLQVDLMAGGHGGAPNTFAEFKAALGL